MVKTYRIHFNPFHIYTSLLLSDLPFCTLWIVQYLEETTLSLNYLDASPQIQNTFSRLGKDLNQKIMGYLQKKELFIIGSVSKFNRKMLWEHSCWDVPAESEQGNKFTGLDRKIYFVKTSKSSKVTEWDVLLYLVNIVNAVTMSSRHIKTMYELQ